MLVDDTTVVVDKPNTFMQTENQLFDIAKI